MANKTIPDLNTGGAATANDLFEISRLGVSYSLSLPSIAAYIGSGTGATIYSGDGTLASARTVTMGTASLTFSGNADINLLPDSSASWVGLNIGVDEYAGVYNSYFGIGLKQSLNLVTSGLFTGNVFNGVTMTCYNDDDIAPAVLFNMARGTSEIPTVLQNGQVSGEIDFCAYTGDTISGLPDFRLGGVIYALMEADASSGKAPMALYFDTSDMDGNVQDRFYIGSSGTQAMSNDVNGIFKSLPTPTISLTPAYMSLNTSQPTNALLYDVEPESMDKISLCFARARGTTAETIAAVGSSDNIGIMTWLGYDGTNFIPTFSLGVTVSSVSPGIVDSYFNFTPQSSLTTFNISSAGVITLGINSGSSLVVTGPAQFTAPAFVGGETQFLGVDNSGNLITVTESSIETIYNSNGSLNSDRTVSLGTYALSFSGAHNDFFMNDPNGNYGFNSGSNITGTANFAVFSAGNTLIDGNNNMILYSGGVSTQIPGSNNFVWNCGGGDDGIFINQSNCVVLNSPGAQVVFGASNSVLIGTPGGQVSGSYDVIINSSGSYTGDGSQGNNLILVSNGSITGGSYSGIIASAGAGISASGSYNLVLASYNSSVSGDASNSVVIGTNISCAYSNNFIWNDGASSFSATANNWFSVQASGGINLNSETILLPVFAGDGTQYLGVNNSGEMVALGASSSFNIYNMSSSLTSDRIVSLDTYNLTFAPTSALITLGGNNNLGLWASAAALFATVSDTVFISGDNGVCIGDSNPANSGIDIHTSYGVGSAYPISTVGGSTSLSPNSVTFALNGNSTAATIPVVLSGTTNKTGRQYTFVDISGLAFGGTNGVTFSTDDGSKINGDSTLVITTNFYGSITFQSIEGNWYYVNYSVPHG
jgi:hypothetical protein